MEPNWSGVSAARDQATSAATSANDFSAKGNVLVDELRKAVGERFGESGIAKDTATARTDFMAAAPKAREDVLGLVNAGSILSPTQQAAIMAAKRSSALMPLMGANLIQDATFGTMEDIINAGTNAFKAETQNRQGLAQIAQGNYSSLLNELLQKAQEDRANQTMQFAANKDARESAMAPLDQMTAQAKLDQLLNGGGGTATERMAAEKQQIMIAATKYKTPDERKEFLLGNGYNPNDPDFSGLFGGKILDLKNAAGLKALGVLDNYQLDPNGSTELIPRERGFFGKISDWFQSLN